MSRVVIFIFFCAFVLANYPANAKSFKLRLSDGSRMSTFIYKPKGKGPHPAVIVLPVRSGMNQYSKNWSAKLAKKGYVTLTVNYRTGGGWPDVNVGEAYDYLKELPEVDPKRIGLVGFSFGGQRALEIVYEWANGYPPRPILGMVMYYPGSNIPFPNTDVPPILFLHGDSDEVRWQEISDYCKETKKEGRVCEYKIYKNTTHSFTHRTKYTRRYKGESVTHAMKRRRWKHNPSAERDAFARSVKFLQKHLKDAPIQ